VWAVALPESWRRRPIAAGAVALATFLVVAFPVWLATVWPLVSDRVFLDVMAERRWGLVVVGPLYGWFTVVLGVIAVVLLIVLIIASPRSVPLSGVSETPRLQLPFNASLSLPSRELPEAPRKVRTPRRPIELMDILYTNELRTVIDAKLKPHLGCLMTVQGPVHDLAIKDAYCLVTVLIEGSTRPLGEYLYLYFPTSTKARLELCQRGDVIAGTGTIRSIDAMGITLEDCELEALFSGNSE